MKYLFKFWHKEEFVDKFRHQQILLTPWLIFVTDPKCSWLCLTSDILGQNGKPWYYRVWHPLKVLTRTQEFIKHSSFCLNPQKYFSFIMISFRHATTGGGLRGVTATATPNHGFHSYPLCSNKTATLPYPYLRSKDSRNTKRMNPNDTNIFLASLFEKIFESFLCHLEVYDSPVACVGPVDMLCSMW